MGRRAKRVPRFPLLLLLLAWALHVVVADPSAAEDAACTPGNATFALLAATPAPRCQSSPLALDWGRLRVALTRGCDFTLAVGPRVQRQAVFSANIAALGGILDFDSFFRATFDAASGSGQGQLRYRAFGGSGFVLEGTPDGCSLRYRLIRGGYPGLTMEDCMPGLDADCPEACTPGYGLMPLEGAASAVCAPCLPGTFSPGGPAAVCSDCPSGTTAEAIGSATCRQTEQQQAAPAQPTQPQPAQQQRARKGAQQKQSSCDGLGAMDTRFFVATYTGPDGICSSATCPAGSVPAPNGLCVSAEVATGHACEAATVPATRPPPAGILCLVGGTPWLGGPPAVGGAVVELAGGVQNAQGPLCGGAVAALAAELGQARSWMGLNFSAAGVNPTGDEARVKSGLFWALAADDALLSASTARFGLVLKQPGGGVRAYALDLTRADSREWAGHLRGTLTGRSWGPDCQGAGSEALPPLEGSCLLYFKVRGERMGAVIVPFA
ncbi:hypothetical protein Rsub_12769 [Raphidocelis subcapitata]|uniref:Tyrosine-protein kinase ephrin type A/B receptor-like domain-containing protein n=1 Tax=Raphidocelis subcapitata TaxID=307507 RepID=A0A2V0PJT9_9CHLO|nr:hypothetical protein Rsub_12769 [Raphidocelis subcapitata]|eukprot:GBG00072.1 hypothetical protein Rsub_12769 [Raphidocelis subcapitata]